MGACSVSIGGSCGQACWDWLMPAPKPSTRRARSRPSTAGSGLPWRQALGTLMLVSVVGGADSEVAEMVDVARETFQRLGAQPLLRWLDRISAVSHPAGPSSIDAGRPRPTIEVSP